MNIKTRIKELVEIARKQGFNLAVIFEDADDWEVQCSGSTKWLDKAADQLVGLAEEMIHAERHQIDDILEKFENEQNELLN